MATNNEINQEVLETVSGGDTYDSLEKLSFLFGEGLHVEVHTFRIPRYQFTSGGTITKKGYTHSNGVYSPCYYVTCEDDDDSGWYDEDYLQDTTYGRWKKIDTSKTPVTVVD